MLQGLTIQHGDASSSPTAGYEAPGTGGGIFVFPGVTLTLSGSTITDNQADGGHDRPSSMRFTIATVRSQRSTSAASCLRPDRVIS